MGTRMEHTGGRRKDDERRGKTEEEEDEEETRGGKGRGGRMMFSLPLLDIRTWKRKRRRGFTTSQIANRTFLDHLFNRLLYAFVKKVSFFLLWTALQ